MEASRAIDEAFEPRSVYRISQLRPAVIAEASLIAEQGAHDYFADIIASPGELPATDSLNLAGKYDPAEIARLSLANRSLSRMALLHTHLSDRDQDIPVYGNGRELALHHKIQMLGDFIGKHGCLWVTEDAYAQPEAFVRRIPLLELIGVGYDIRSRNGISAVVKGRLGHARVFREPAALFYGPTRPREED